MSNFEDEYEFDDDFDDGGFDTVENTENNKSFPVFVALLITVLIIAVSCIATRLIENGNTRYRLYELGNATFLIEEKSCNYAGCGWKEHSTYSNETEAVYNRNRLQKEYESKQKVKEIR